MRYIKGEKNKDENTKLIFSKLFNLDRVSAEKEMSHSLGMEPFDKYEHEIVSKIKEIVGSNTKYLIDITWLGMSIINHNGYVEEEILNKLSEIIKKLDIRNLYH